MRLERLRVDSRREIARGIYETVFEYPERLPEINPGQFINVYPKSPVLTLPRPLSVCDAISGRLKIVYRTVGEGTRELAGRVCGDMVDVMLPLGNGFDLSGAAGKPCVLAGGGLGIPPLVMLARALRDMGASFSVFLGFSEEPFLLEELEALCDNVFVASESGGQGEKGTVLDLLRRHDAGGELYFSCGPAPMLKALCGYISDKGAMGQMSLEQRMACGFGACVGCAVRIRDGDSWQYLKVCKDGPVFSHEVILWD